MIPLQSYHYDLPEDRIALYPQVDRNGSKLLSYNQGEIKHLSFSELATVLPENSLLVFNRTKVIPARVFAFNSKGKRIEILLLKPHLPSKDPLIALSSNEPQVWLCMVGNRRGWKEDESLEIIFENLKLIFFWANREDNLVGIKWENQEWVFSEILERIGKVPLPPYLRRSSELIDVERYQTVYALNSGSVAAPTAGLHFDESMIEKLKAYGHKIAFITLHVGAGTFLPVKTENMLDHPMHAEQFEVDAYLIEQLAKHDGPIIPVGTTSMRALESLPFLINNNVLQNRVVQFPDKNNYSNRSEMLNQLVDELQKLEGGRYLAETSIMIYPSFKPLVCNALMTNFHQPGSTLLLLVSALIGEDWKKIYNEALEQKYRFLSYGDTSLLLW
jgi:S-adenosylmethionine:tRNA ribosyltransferase-isomerase